MNLPRFLAPFCFAALVAGSTNAMEMEVTPLPRILPDGLVAEGDLDIFTAWLSHPTDRYPHGVLGDLIEAGGLSVVTREGTRLSLILPQTAVFEDRYPRLADLDGDGRDEMIVVKSTQTEGAALVVAGLRDGKVKILAESPPIGQPNRWLNPIGVGDFDADGQMEIAYVETPHIAGTLRVVSWQGDKLVEEYASVGYSNHHIGTAELGLATVLDTNEDGIVDIVVPNAGRRGLHVLTIKDGKLEELAHIPFSAPLIRLMTQYKNLKALIAVLANGHTAALRFKTKP